jgi:uncharacterized protein YkwD
MKKILGLIFVLCLAVLCIVIPAEKSYAADENEISFQVTYMQSDARQMVDMINNYRAANGKYPESQKALLYDYDLEQVAMQRAAEIVLKFDTDHYRPDGSKYLQAFGEKGFNISPRGVMYGENILFGTENTMPLDKAFPKFCEDAGLAENMTGYYSYVGVAHVKMEDKIDFWVQVYASKGKNTNYVAPVDGLKEVTVRISPSMVESLDVTYSSGDHTVKAGETKSVPSYIPKVKIIGSELKDELILSPLVFESVDGNVQASGGTMTGLKEGTGTITAKLLGRTFSYNVTVTAGSGVIQPTTAPTPVPTAEPTPVVTPVPTETPQPTTAPTSTPVPTSKPDKKGVNKGDKFEINGIKYTAVSSTSFAVTGLTSKTATSVTIPDSVNISGTSYKITKIGAGAFKGYKSLKEVSIGNNVTTIGKKALYGCKALKKITIQSSNIKSVGAKAFYKVYKKAKIYVPEKVVTKYAKLFKKAKLSSTASVLKK